MKEPREKDVGGDTATAQTISEAGCVKEGSEMVVRESSAKATG
jgi:hypothetical protein